MTDEKKLIDKILKTCSESDLEATKSLMKEINIDFSHRNYRKTAEKIYKAACLSGNLNLVDELIYLTDGDEHTSFIKSILNNLIECKQKQYYPIISYLVNEPRLEPKRSPPDRISEFYGNLNGQIEWAATNDNLPLLKALLNTHEPDKRNKWVFTTNSLFKTICNFNNIEIMKYLYTEPKFKSLLHPLIGFMEACKAENSDAIQFLIFDYKIEKNEQAEAYLRKTGNRDILKLLEIRDLNKELNNELQHNSDITKRIKL